jgi:hypothetical protein
VSTFWKALQQPEYVHVLLNHLPLTGLLVAVVMLAGALILNNRQAMFLSLILVGLLSLSAWPVSEFGEDAYDRVLSMSNEDGAAYLKRHAQLAHHWVFLFYVTAGAAGLAMVVGWKSRRHFRKTSVGVLVLALGSLAAGAVIADYGGKIRHREFRYGPPPAQSHRTHGAGQPRLPTVGRPGTSQTVASRAAAPPAGGREDLAATPG